MDWKLDYIEETIRELAYWPEKLLLFTFIFVQDRTMATLVENKAQPQWDAVSWPKTIFKNQHIVKVSK